MTQRADIHAGQSVIVHGTPLAEARAAVILLHGRGASAESMLELAALLAAPQVALLAPQAAGSTWYPQRFTAPTARNEPWLSSALNAVDRVVQQVGAAGIPAERTLVLGFSQGACLGLEYAARNPRHYGGVVALSGALIENGDQPRDYVGTLAGTPVFIGCSDRDAHIPEERVERSAVVLQSLGAEVTARIYPGLGHTINQDEIDAVNRLIAQTMMVDR